MDAMAIAGPIDRISTNRASEMSGASSFSFLDEGQDGNRFTQSLLEANQEQSLSHEKQLLKDHSGRAAPQPNRASGAENTSEDDAVTASNTRGPGALEMPSSTMKQGNNGKSLPAQDRQDLPLEGNENPDRAIAEPLSAFGLAPQSAISSDVDRAAGSIARFTGRLSISGETSQAPLVVDSRSVLVGQGVVGQLGAGALSENLSDATSSKRSNTKGDAAISSKATESQRLSTNPIAEEDDLLSGLSVARATSAKIGDGIMTTQAAPQVQGQRVAETLSAMGAKKEDVGPSAKESPNREKLPSVEGVRLNQSSTTLGRIGALELVVHENQRSTALGNTVLVPNSVKQDVSVGAPLVKLGQTGVSIAESRDPFNPTTLNGVTSSNQRIGTTGEDTLLQPLIRQAQLKLGLAQVDSVPSESLRLVDVRDAGHRMPLVEALVAELEGKASMTDARSQQSISVERSWVTASPLSSAGALPLDTGQLSPMPKSGVTSMYQAIVAGKLDQPAWMEQIAGHAKMAIEKDFRVVEIRLKPAHLGTIEILMKQDADQTQLTFFSRHQAVRDALDAQMPRLEELFQEDGLTLGETSVSDRSLAEQWHGEQESETKGVSLSSLQDHEASQDVDSVADHADAQDAESHRLDLWA